MQASNNGRTHSIQPDFSLAEVRGIVKDLFAPQAWIYWTDFLASLTAGSTCFLLLRHGVPRWNTDWTAKIIVGLLLYALTCLLYYRAVLFVHELVHMRAGTFKAFSFVWNLCCGIPFLVPTFAYYTHVDHHMRSHFGTASDGEYIPLASQRPMQILVYLTQPFVVPILATLRFLVITPFCWFSPRIRGWAHRRASTLVMDPSYIRPLPPPKTLRVFRWQETACFLLLLTATIATFLGYLKIAFIVQSYLVAVGVLMLNNVRTLGAHRYVSGGEEMTFVEQLLDSINYPNFSLTTPLWAPVGLRYHALHHLCPSLPYHNMGKAHRRLMEQLPENSPYRQTNSPSLLLAIRQLWRRAAEHTAGASPTAAAPSDDRNAGGALGGSGITGSGITGSGIAGGGNVGSGMADREMTSQQPSPASRGLSPESGGARGPAPIGAE